MKQIIPAILTQDIADLQSKLKKIQGLTDWVQIDIMDGKFVNNTSITLENISHIKLIDNFSIEAHLMVLNPETYFLQCQKGNVKRVSFHVEAGNIKNILSEAKKFNFQKGLALNPETPIKEIIPHMDEIDFVVLMSVNPGLQGQKFISQTLGKIQELKQIAPQLEIEVDGGINLDNIKMISDAGANYLVVGSGLFEGENIKKRFKDLQSKIK